MKHVNGASTISAVFCGCVRLFQVMLVAFLTVWPTMVVGFLGGFVVGVFCV